MGGKFELTGHFRQRKKQRNKNLYKSCAKILDKKTSKRFYSKCTKMKDELFFSIANSSIGNGKSGFRLWQIRATGVQEKLNKCIVNWKMIFIVE